MTSDSVKVLVNATIVGLKMEFIPTQDTGGNAVVIEEMNDAGLLNFKQFHSIVSK